jgi:hypothetical protein
MHPCFLEVFHCLTDFCYGSLDRARNGLPCAALHLRNLLIGKPELVVEDEPPPLKLRQLCDGLAQLLIALAVKDRFLYALW